MQIRSFFVLQRNAFACIPDLEMAAAIHPPTTAADLDFAGFVASLMARPQLTAADESFACFCEQGAFALAMMAAMRAQMQAPTEASGRAFRHGLHVAQAPVFGDRAKPRRPLKDVVTTRQAAKRAWQISAPLDELLAAGGAR